MGSIFSRPFDLTSNLLVLDGMTGTGKTMFLPYLSSFKGVQQGRFEYMIEYLNIAFSNKGISSDSFESLIKILVDSKFYDGIISREVNFRPNDLSSVLNSSKRWEYIKQLFQNDGDYVIQKLESEMHIPFFVTHQLIGKISGMQDVFKDNLKIIEMVRHPAYLFNHWLSYIDQHGSSKRDFTMLLESGEGLVPWFAEPFKEKYISLKSEDKVMMSLYYLFLEVIKKKQEKSKNVIIIPFEEFVLNPSKFTNLIEKQFSLSATNKTIKFLNKENVPRRYIYQGLNKNIYKRYGFQKETIEISHREHLAKTARQFINKLNSEALEMYHYISRYYLDNFSNWSNND